MCFGENNMQSIDKKNLTQLLLSTKTHRPSATFVIPPLNAFHQWVLVAYSPPIKNVPCSANSSFCKATNEPWSDLSGKRTLGLFNAITQWLEPLTCCRMSVSALEVLRTSASTRATIVDPSSQSDDDLLGPGTRDFATLGATFHWNIHKRPVSTVAFELGWPTKPRSSKNEVLVKESETSWRSQKPSRMTHFVIERSCPTSGRLALKPVGLLQCQTLFRRCCRRSQQRYLPSTGMEFLDPSCTRRLKKQRSGSLSGWRHLGAVKRTFSTSMLIPGVNKVSVQYIKHCHTDKDKHYTWSLPKGREGMRSAWDFFFCSEAGPRLRSLQIHLKALLHESLASCSHEKLFACQAKLGPSKAGHKL